MSDGVKTWRIGVAGRGTVGGGRSQFRVEKPGARSTCSR